MIAQMYTYDPSQIPRDEQTMKFHVETKERINTQTLDLPNPHFAAGTFTEKPANPNLEPADGTCRRTMALRGRNGIGNFYRTDDKDIQSWKSIHLNSREDLDQGMASATFIVKDRPRSAGLYTKRSDSEKFDLHPEHRFVRSRNANGNSYRSDDRDTRGWEKSVNGQPPSPLRSMTQRVRSFQEAQKFLPAYQTVNYDVVTFKDKSTGEYPSKELSDGDAAPKPRTMALRGRTAIGAFYRADAADFNSWQPNSPHNEHVPRRPIRTAEKTNGNFIGIFENQQRMTENRADRYANTTRYDPSAHTFVLSPERY